MTVPDAAPAAPMGGPWRVRGLRGATTVDENTREAILAATRELLAAMIARNGIQPEDVASAWFTTSLDLNAEFPAVVARREMGWEHVALMCGHEMDVPGSLAQCLRILVHINTPKRQDELEHVYLHGAVALRPEMARPVPAPSPGDAAAR